jgi:hypothetical protein
MKIARATEIVDKMAAVKNIRSYASAVGYVCELPLTTTEYWYPCMYMAATAGAIELPIILSRLVIPNDIPLSSRGVERMMIF